MARFPSPYSGSSPSVMRPRGPIAEIDTSGLARGQQDIARGFDRLSEGLMSASSSFANIAEADRKKTAAAQIAVAEAAWTRSALELGNQFDERGDYERFAEDGEAETRRIMDEAAANITDEDFRQRWLQETELKRISVADSITDLGRTRLQEKERIAFTGAIEDNARLASDPTMAPALRDKARLDIKSAIDTGEGLALIRPSEAEELRRKYLDGADELLAINTANMRIQTGDPRQVMAGMAVSGPAGGNSLAASSIAASGGATLPLPFEVAQQAATALGDRALPRDPDLAAAYLTDPEMNARYVGAAIDQLSTRFKGDVTAAVIAIAPGGGLAMAERWVRSRHDEDELSPQVRKFYRKALAGMTSEADTTPLPVIAAPDVDLARIEVGVLERYEQLQGVFGRQLPVISGFRDETRNKEVGGASKSQHIEGQALDINVAGMPKEERVRFIEMASALGFTGIGVYNNTIHLDAGSRRAWGPSHHRDSVPGWAEDVIARHERGAITELVPRPGTVAPEYAALTYDQRLKLFQAAKQEADRQALDMRAGLQLAVENAPAAIMATGSYDETTPTVDDFVQAYGAAEGIQRFKAFDSSIDVAHSAFGMRTMTGAEIADLVDAAVPTASGNDAALEAQRFEVLSKAAESTLQLREADPAGYVLQTFPRVAEAWDAVSDDAPDSFARAVALTAEAQTKLGMDLAPLPKDMASQAAATFNSTELPQDQRVAAVTGLVLQVGDDTQQAAIFQQLVGAGVPPHVQGAFAALERGDQAAASYLFRAAVIDPAKLPGQLPNDIKATEVTERIQDMLLDEGQIGDIVYGISDGTAENFDRLRADGVLMERAVKLRLLDGSAATVTQAVEMTARDMFGDRRVVAGRGWGDKADVRITAGKDEDVAPLRRGFDALLGTVGEALQAEINPVIAGAATSTGEAAVMAAVRDNGINRTLADGYFTERNGGYVFIEPATGSAVTGSDGKPLVFSRLDVLEAAAAAGSWAAKAWGR